MPPRKPPRKPARQKELAKERGTWWQRLSTGEKVLSVIGVLTLLAASLVIPEVREVLHLRLESQLEIPKQPTQKPPSDLKNPGVEKEAPVTPTFKVVPLPNAAPLPEPAGPMMTLDNEIDTSGYSKGSKQDVLLSGGKHATEKAALAMHQVMAVTPEDAARHLVHRVDPIYPPLARQARIQGHVIFVVRIGKDGRVKDIKLLSGHPMLAVAAEDAVKQWRYTPFAVHGEPMEAETRVDVEFTVN